MRTAKVRPEERGRKERKENPKVILIAERRKCGPEPHWEGQAIRNDAHRGGSIAHPQPSRLQDGSPFQANVHRADTSAMSWAGAASNSGTDISSPHAAQPFHPRELRQLCGEKGHGKGGGAKKRIGA